MANVCHHEKKHAIKICPKLFSFQLSSELNPDLIYDPETGECICEPPKVEHKGSCRLCEEINPDLEYNPETGECESNKRLFTETVLVIGGEKPEYEKVTDALLFCPEDNGMVHPEYDVVDNQGQHLKYLDN